MKGRYLMYLIKYKPKAQMFYMYNKKKSVAVPLHCPCN